jgi:hypothetical protein
VAKGIGERQLRPNLSAIDAIQAGPRHLQQTQASAGRGHLLAEAHGDQNIGIAKLRQNGHLVARDDLARNAQATPDRLGQLHGKRSRKSSLHDSRPSPLQALLEQCLARDYRDAKVGRQLRTG